MEAIKQLTDIKRIGIVKRTGDQWSRYTKKFNIDVLPEMAAIRFEAMGVCSVYINGEFLEGTTGRYAGRVAYFECTSLLKKGENEITIKLGDHYHQIIGEEIRARRGAIISSVAAELEFISGDKRTTLVTDESWALTSDDGQTETIFFSDITVAEYDRLWKSAAIWHEHKGFDIPDAVASFAGEDYVDYTKNCYAKYAYPKKVFNSKH